jgi:hypothetical protein
MGKNIVITEDKLRAVIRTIIKEQKVDLITTIQEMGFIPTSINNYKHKIHKNLTLKIEGENVIVKKGLKEIGRVNVSDIIDLEGIIKSSFPLEEQVIKGSSGDPYEYKKEGNIYYARKKGSSSWIKTSGNASKAIATKIFKETPTVKTDDKKITQTPPKKPEKPNVIVSDTLVNKKIFFDPTLETTPFKCSEEGCAEWVSNQLDDLGVPRQGNAWHSHNIGQKNLKFTPFMKLNPTVQSQMANLFSKINAKPIEKSQENSVKSLVNNLMPNQSTLKNTLNVNDIVGLYYDDSTNFTKAFFEGGTGMGDMGSGSKITDGPYFIKKDGTPWTPNDLEKNIQFYPGKSLRGGSGFGMNTHLGYVGAKVDGEPIIFHNVHGQVYATPLNKMGKTKIFWVKKGPGEVVIPKEENKSWYDSFLNLF